MGDRYKAIKQKWEMDYDGCRFFMDYDGYKLKALHQKKTYRGSNVAVSKQNKCQSQCYWHLTKYFLKRIRRKSSLIQ